MSILLFFRLFYWCETLVHYYKTFTNWQGYIIDEGDYNAYNQIKKRENKIYIIYVKAIYNKGSAEILFSKTDMITGINEIYETLIKLNTFPNPFSNYLNISFENNTQNRLRLNIYSIDGKKIATLMDEIKPSGKYDILLNGKDKNGKDVNSGLYLIRLQSGRNILTRSAEYIK